MTPKVLIETVSEYLAVECGVEFFFVGRFQIIRFMLSFRTKPRAYFWMSHPLLKGRVVIPSVFVTAFLLHRFLRASDDPPEIVIPEKPIVAESVRDAPVLPAKLETVEASEIVGSGASGRLVVNGRLALRRD